MSWIPLLLTLILSWPWLCLPLAAKTLSEKTKRTHHSQPVLAKMHFTASENSQTLPKAVLKLLKKYKIPKQDLSIYIRDLNAPRPLLELNVDTLRSPASTMKLLTTYAALKELGPNYSWRTGAWLRGDLVRGVLHGDLVLKGYGDPFLVFENFWKLLRTLRDKGLREIKGDVIVDNSYFDLPKHDPAAFDGKPFRIYNAAPSAMMFNFQATRFLFRPVIPGKLSATKNNLVSLKKTAKIMELQKLPKKAKKSQNKKTKKFIERGTVSIIPYPSIHDFKFENQVKLSRGKCRQSHFRPYFSKNKKGTLLIKGSYAERCKQQFILRSISTPENHVFNAFRDIWADLGGIHHGGFKSGQIKNGDERFHSYRSPTLGSLMRLINKWSNNVMTRQLFVTLGARKYGPPGTLEKGKKAVLEILADNQINTKGIEIENGSGLSRTSRISVSQMAKLLETAYRDAYMPEFMASLSLPGIDGTLVNRFRHEDLRGRSHFKTGTLTGASAIAGYMLNRNGKRLVIVIIQNGKKVGAGRSRKIQDTLLRWSFEQ